MIFRSTILFLGLILAISCKKEYGTFPVSGSYKGTFQRQINGTGPISHINIIFTGEKWMGQSDSTKYPALCKGSFRKEGDNINFLNDCAWTAEFDWTLILNSSYKLSTNGDQIEITRSYSNGTRDIYKLTKQ